MTGVTMFLQQLPDVIRWVLLFGVGAAVGSLVNLAIYQLALQKRNISPWSPTPDSVSQKRGWLDRIPVIGWLRLRRESSVHGTGFWIRPMLIEIALGAGLAWYFDWHMNGGLYGGEATKLVTEQTGLAGSWAGGWFLFHSVLIALMVAATFIDFDEQTIPDWITIPGTVFALVCLAIVPALRLPLRRSVLLKDQLAPLNYWTPDPASGWHTGWQGILVSLLIVVVWCFALTPKWTTLRFGFWRGIKIMFASILRPPRKTSGTIPRVAKRKMFIETRVLCVLAVVMAALVSIMFFRGGESWTAVFDSLLGLAMGGGIVWAVRIIASQALGVEAMGFGDVTLMAMIGAFVGWQPALIIFVMAPFTSLIVVVGMVIARMDNQLAFGPYLCIATVIVIIGWDWVWNDWMAKGPFSMGNQYVLIMLGVCLVAMPIMLFAWSKIKNRD